jgi:AcrR family transcriptional regulator
METHRMGRRDDLAEQATDYVLEHGLIGLSLRPLAAALGTSDRMLIYHFGDKDALVADVIARSTRRAVDVVESLPTARTVRAGVLALWRALVEPELDRCLRLYIQGASLGVLGADPYRKVIANSNAEWDRAVRDYLVGCGAQPRHAPRIARLVDAALTGFHLSIPVLDDPHQLETPVRDLAATAQRISDSG